MSLDASTLQHANTDHHSPIECVCVCVYCVEEMHRLRACMAHDGTQFGSRNLLLCHMTYEWINSNG